MLLSFKSLFSEAKKPDPEKEAKFVRGGSHDISDGPLGNRRCTDVACLVIFFAYWACFLLVTFTGFQDGSPAKLYRPRDFQGAYCGIENQWNSGPNQDGRDKLTFMMNVSATVDVIAKQLLCSSVSSTALLNSNLSKSEKDEYMCNCCLVPCASCAGSHEIGRDLANLGALTTIADRLSDLTSMDPTSVSSLFNPAGPNGDMFNKMWNQATQYLTQVCLPDCNIDYTGLNATDTRIYQYKPDPDDPLRLAWDTLLTSGPREIQEVMKQDFNFTALPSNVCNYPEIYCVPFPGIKFAEIQNGYCTFQMANEVIDTVGNVAASIFETTGMDTFAKNTGATIGVWAGDLVQSIDTHVIVCVCCFAIGLIFLVLLRFFVKFCVWFAICFVLVIFVIGGGISFFRSYQCVDADLFQTGEQTANIVIQYADHTISNALQGTQTPKEDLVGPNNANYSGVQRFTRSGRECKVWGQDSIYTAGNYPYSGLLTNSGQNHSFCRNPFKSSDVNIADTIWCFTTDPDKRWELCDPIGVLATCEHGYAVPGETMREALRITAYIIWGLGGLWVLLVIVFRNRIRLAIALNRVAADFVAQNPRILVVPMVEILLGCIWCLVWIICASFILSQVPDSHTPTGYFASYADAAEKCTDKDSLFWSPAGFVWKDAICDGSDTPNCWRCAPPRFILGTRFGISLFSYLWNNWFLVALGQCIIAGAVGAWFFAPNSEKGKRKVITPSIWNAFRYHTGSLAFGAFLIAMVQFIRYCMALLQKQAEVRRNLVCVWILRSLQCCMWCFEKCLQFLNKNAYIQIALLGTNFCTSAKKAFFLIVRNAVRFGTLATLGKVIHFIGYLFIMTSTVIVGYFLLRVMHADISPAIPLLVYAFLSYIIGKLFMAVFGLAVDTSLQCFLICEEMNLTGDFVPVYLRKCLKVEDTPGDYEGKILPLEANDANEPLEMKISHNDVAPSIVV